MRWGGKPVEKGKNFHSPRVSGKKSPCNWDDQKCLGGKNKNCASPAILRRKLARGKKKGRRRRVTIDDSMEQTLTEWNGEKPRGGKQGKNGTQ